MMVELRWYCSEDAKGTENAPCGEFRAPCAPPLDGVLQVVITNVADALVTPAATWLPIALHNATHP